MKKLQLKLEGKEMLTKDQLKKVAGGYGGDCGSQWMCQGTGLSTWACYDLSCFGATSWVCSDGPPGGFQQCSYYPI